MRRLTMRVAIRELKNHFSKYLKQVQTGAEIIVTTHGKPVARLSQVDATHEYSLVDPLQNLVWVRKSQSGKPKGLPVTQRVKLSPGKILSEMLLEDRE